MKKKTVISLMMVLARTASMTGGCGGSGDAETTGADSDNAGATEAPAETPAEESAPAAEAPAEEAAPEAAPEEESKLKST